MLTLIGESMAKTGMKFIFEGAGEECNTCKLRFTCSTMLEKGRVYEIVDVKSQKHFCPKDDAYLTLVEIVEPSIQLAVKSRSAIEGMTIEYEEPCGLIRCPNRDQCIPIGISDREKVKIIKIIKSVDCPEGSKKIVEVKRT